LGIFHFFENSRSLGLLTLFTGLILIYGSAKIQRLLAGKNMLTVIFGAIILAVFGYALLKSYEFAAAKGFLGAAAEDKYREQSEKTNNLISAARGEYVASWAAIADSPLIGHGSWAKNTKYIEIFLAGQGINLSSSEARSFMQTEFIPTHSHIFGAWVEAGILGAVFWAYIAFLAVRVLVRVLRPEWAVYRPLVIYLTLTILFDIAFSPFGLERRMTDAAIITGFIIILNRGAGGSTEGRAGMQYFLRPSEVQGVLPFRRAPVHEVCPDARRPNRL
jgi:O-antigen ligase